MADKSDYQEQIFSQGSAHFKSLLSDLAAAQKTIDLETFTFRKDQLGWRVAESLAKAAERGVRVRVMVDGVGTPRWSADFAGFLERHGVTTKVFHPFPWQLWNWRRSENKMPFFLRWLYLLLKINFRNHRKVCIIDNTIAYIGSYNINEYHLPKEEGGRNWRDTSVRLVSSAVGELSRAFDVAWHSKRIKERLREAFKKVRQEPQIRLNDTRHRRRLLYKQLLRKMRRCQRRIWITNAYFVPDNFLLKCLTEAAHSGVDVRILLPQKSDVMMMPWASSTFYFSLLQSGVRIFEYLPSMLHAKILILDDWMLVGSSNLNYRSLLHDLEADVTIQSAAAKTVLSQQFLLDITHSCEVSLESWWRLRPWQQRFLGRLVLYIKYWI